jgi:ATP-binding cassette subfamily B protein/subfamily B ATP-binding cassette protein MsbA
MTSLDQEEELIQQKLFNKEVFKLLFTYVARYWKYLGYALFFVLVTTTTTLLIPVLSKTIIDKGIVKTGYIAKISDDSKTSSELEFANAVKKNGLFLEDNYWFVYQSTMKGFSKALIDKLTADGILSKQKYTPVENRDFAFNLGEKVKSEINSGHLLEIGTTVLLTQASGSRFTTSEMMELRTADLKKVAKLSILMIFLFCTQFIASYLQILALMQLSQRAMRDLRTDLFSHLLSLEISFFDRNPVGKLISRVTNDIESLNEMFSSVIVNMSQNLLVMTGVIVMMFIADTYLATLVCVSIPFLIVIVMIFRAKARAAYRLIRTKIADLNTFLNENISGIRITQIFVQENKQFTKFKKINKEVYSANIQQLNIYAVFRPLIDFFKWFSIGTVIYFGAQSMLDNRISYGLIVMFLAYISTFFEPIGELAEKIDILQNATASGEKILSIFKTRALKETTLPSLSSPQEVISQTPVQELRFKGEIVFDDVWFAYTPGEWVLKGVSFTITPQSTLAVVGETGSGKSTIISLLAKFYVIQKGKITIDGVDINDIPYPVLRKNISIVMQDVFLFSRSVKENIVLNGLYNNDRFDKILDSTNAGVFIDRLPGKSDEMVMERGVTFSAGERQLLAFARSLYADPSILILDEATSNIDTHTEQLIQEAISHVVKGRTSIAIAHRLSTVRDADQIIVLDDGRIAESGTHESLLLKNGLYYELYRFQFENA